ncbi:hypothetical protein [Brucella sp. BZ]|uniref:hypothetical protein n=1 Tax=Brucella sp. BZ TaxID=3381346 RepID=UPI0039E77AE1
MTAKLICEPQIDAGFYVDRLRQLQGKGDTENQHLSADGVLCDLLKQLGFEAVVDEFEKVDKWYA